MPDTTRPLPEPMRPNCIFDGGNPERCFQCHKQYQSEPLPRPCSAAPPVTTEGDGYSGWIYGNNYKQRGRVIASNNEPWYESDDGHSWSAYDVRFVPDESSVTTEGGKSELSMEDDGMYSVGGLIADIEALEASRAERYAVFGPGMSGRTNDLVEAETWLCNNPAARLYELTQTKEPKL